MVLYRQPGVCVTTEWFIVASRRFPIRELTGLHTARGPHHPVAVRAVVVAWTMIAVIGASISFLGDIHRVAPGVYLALGAAAFVPALITLLGQRLRPRAYELWARYRGRQMLIFATDSEREFGQVTRALIRAREMARLGGVTDAVASRHPWRDR